NSPAGQPAQRQSAQRPEGLILPPEEVTLDFPPAPANDGWRSEWRGCLATTTLPDRTVLLATAGSPDLELWELAAGRHRRALAGHADLVSAMAWAQAPGEQLLLATASRDGTTRIWAAGTGNCLSTLTGNGGEVKSVAWARTSDGRLLLAASNSSSTAQI